MAFLNSIHAKNVREMSTRRVKEELRLLANATHSLAGDDQSATLNWASYIYHAAKKASTEVCVSTKTTGLVV